MSAPAAIRPDEWELPLFVHVLGALALIGALTVTLALLVPAWRSGSSASLRTALRALTLGVIPAYLVMRVGAEWIADKEGWADLDDPPSWINIGYVVGDLGLLLAIVASLLAWWAFRKGDPDRPSPQVRIAVGLIGFLLLINVIALWAMTAKPT